jgi:hypothetical protein
MRCCELIWKLTSERMNELQRVVGIYFLLINRSGMDVFVPRAPEYVYAFIGF